MSIRKEKEREFFTYHLDKFKAIGIADPLFLIKSAYYQKGKHGRQLQLFESELKKNEDIYMEFYDNVYDPAGKIINMVPMFEDRPLFKYKYNPYYHEEYEIKEGVSATGTAYTTYIVPVSEIVVIQKDGSEITYNLYEKRKEEMLNNVNSTIAIPQKSLFPDFESEFNKKPTESNSETDDAPLSEITIRDLAAIMLMKPVSNKKWLNDLVNAKDKAPWE